MEPPEGPDVGLTRKPEPALHVRRSPSGSVPVQGPARVGPAPEMRSSTVTGDGQVTVGGRFDKGLRVMAATRLAPRALWARTSKR